VSVAARIIVLHVIAWLVARSLSDPSLDPYGDMLETWHWGQTFSLGSDKHPPLSGWVAGLWFLIFPTSNVAYYLLAYLNAAVGLLGVNALVHRLPGMLPGRDPVPVLICAAMMLPFSVLAVKFNANAILMSVWPWLIYCFLRALTEPGVRFSILTGLLGALAMLGKYFSIVVLLTLFVVSVTTPMGRQWWRTPAPWAALVTGFVVFAPHLVWLVANGGTTLSYAFAQNEVDSEGGRRFIRFLLLPLAFGLPALVLLTMATWQRGGVRSALMAVLQAWIPRDYGMITQLTLLPWVLTLICGVTGLVTLSSPWALPLLIMMPFYWLQNLRRAPISPMIMARGFQAWLCAILLVSPLYGFYESMRGSDNYYVPRQEAAKLIADQWPPELGRSPSWVAGPWPEIVSLSFYGDQAIAAIDAGGPTDTETSEPGVILCPMGFVERNLASPCPDQAAAWLSRHDRESRFLMLEVARSGFRFLHHRPYRYQVYYVGHQRPVE